MDIYEQNRQRIAMVGSSGRPSTDKMPLGTVIEHDPVWVCSCCDQDIPRPSGGFATPGGSFCAECFVQYVEHLFDGTPPEFLCAIRDETHRFITDRRRELEEGTVPRPVVRATTIRDVTRAERERIKGRILGLFAELEEEDF